MTIQHLKDDLKRTTREYVERARSESTKQKNLTHEEKEELRSLKERVNQSEVVVYQTDKSGRFSVDTLDNYRDACRIHVENDPTVTQDFHEKAQKMADAHSTLWTRILRAGEGVEGQARIKSNVLVQDSTQAPIYALRKDHKSGICPVRGPPVRPVCGAVAAYNTKLSHLMSLILNEVWKEVESVCLSTEETLAEFKRLNDSDISDDVVVGSADVKALYPNLDIPFAVDKAYEIFYDSAVQIVGIDTEELGLYLALNRTKDQLKELGLLPYCPTRKTRRGRPPTITGCALDECRSKRFGPWQIPNNEPSEQMTRKMLTEAMRVVLLFIMQNHIYTFDDEIKLQSRGGPIGLQLTGVLAQLFMV